MTAAMLLELLTKGPTYELHASNCSTLGSVDTGAYDCDCDCAGPDLLKEIIVCLQQKTT